MPISGKRCELRPARSVSDGRSYPRRSRSGLVGVRYRLLKDALTAGLIVAFAGATSAAGVDIPTLGQPSPFYGAAGKGVKVEATADPTELTLDDAILFTLRITNLDNAPDVRRPDLGELEAFRDFQVEDDSTPASEPAGTRVFRYRLRRGGRR